MYLSPINHLVCVCFCFILLFRWGCEHERIARDAFLRQESPHHENLTAKDCGLLISSEYPFVGASPDAISLCACCGQKILEIKCPYCVRDGLPISGEMDRRDFCMSYDQRWNLKKDHAYYFQVQAQLNVWGLEEGVFVLWTNQDIVTEHIRRDTVFFQEQLESVRHFFITGVLPELVGKWLSRKPVESSRGSVLVPEAVDDERDEEDDDDEHKLWCYCEKPSFGQMISCDGKTCPIQWFHMDCLLIRVPPKGKWYCPHCRKLPKYGKRKNKSK